MTDSKQNKKGFFSCCGCGDEETEKQVYVDTKKEHIDLFSTPQQINIQEDKVVKVFNAPPSGRKSKISFSYHNRSDIKTNQMVDSRQSGQSFIFPSNTK